MSWTQTDIDALKSAIARGLRRARIGGEEVEYQSLGEMRSVLREMEAEVNGSTANQINVSYPCTTRGL